MERIDSNGINIYCITSEEYANIDALKQIIHNEVQRFSTYFIYVEDRGILTEHRVQSQSNMYACYILYSKYILGKRGTSGVYFKAISITSKYDAIISDAHISPLNEGTFPGGVLQQLVDRFLKYSDYLYVNPFNMNSKKIIYANSYTGCIFNKDCKDYFEVLGKAKSSLETMTSIIYRSGVFYIADEQLMYVKPDIFNYLESTYCIARYFKCFPDKNGEILYESISVDELSIIVDTVSLILYDKALEEESRVASLKGDNLFINDMSPKEVECKYLNTTCEVPDLKAFLIDVTDRSNYFFYHISNFNKETTDFTMTVDLDKNMNLIEGSYGKRSFIYRSDILSPMHLYRLLKGWVVNTSSLYINIRTFTPFNSEEYCVNVLENAPDMMIITLLRKNLESEKYHILYDRSKDCFYFIDYSDNSIVNIAYNSNNYNPPLFQISESNIDDIEDEKIRWTYNPSARSMGYMLSYSLMQSIRNRFGEDVSAFS